jgi:thiol-disulfide isomerase/thioredoxin
MSRADEGKKTGMSRADEGKKTGKGAMSDEGPTVDLPDLATMEEVEAFLQKNDFVAIKFGMPGCKPCKTIAPAFEQLLKKFPKVALATIDATRRRVRQMVEQYDIDGVPVFHFFHKTKHQQDLTYQGINPDKLSKRAHALSRLK